MGDDVAPRSVRQRAQLAAWIAAGGIAIFGVLAALVSAQWWPAVALLGLALPMIPVGSARKSAR